LKKKEIHNFKIPITKSRFVDCDESIKEEDIKEEIKEEENVDDPSFTSYSTESDIKQEIKEELKEVDEEQGVEYSNFGTDNLIDFNE
jgi:hypothetical protein